MAVSRLIFFYLFRLLLSTSRCECVLFYNKSPFQVDVSVEVDAPFQEGRYYRVPPGGEEHWGRTTWNRMHIKRTSTPSVDITIDLYHNGYVHFYNEEHVTAAQVYGRDHIRVRIPKYIRRREDRTNFGLDNFQKHFVITGNSGTGKSSLINLLRDISDDDKQAAAVGEVETTMYLTEYTHPDYTKIRLWDTPGAGTRANPSHEYFQDKSIYIFDSIIILSAGRFLEAEHKIVKEAMDWNVPVFLVRNKAKIDYDNRKRRKIKESEQDYIDEVKNDVTRNLNQNEILRANIYVIDTNYPDLFQYKKFKQDLLGEKQQSDKDVL
ncbi:unnamed protein product [Adineta ricciae]|uniref:IRG-type G domain-containing protein n=1 Tax=Adineta ricciae TaxID=249248 RepID=A0A815W6J5_ADIRI|nr:unnamed protein product [Adineta ricciae]CAF1629306.1 unnamed protein product [Adineta ricciae]